MEKVHKVIISFFVVSIIVLAGLYLVYLNLSKNSLPDSNILYYGDTCPHCKIVEEFIVNNSISDKITLEHKEVYKNKTNADELILVAKACKLDTSSIGVPFLYYKDECYIGDVDIIDLLKKEANLGSS